MNTRHTHSAVDAMSLDVVNVFADTSASSHATSENSQISPYTSFMYGKTGTVSMSSAITSVWRGDRFRLRRVVGNATRPTTPTIALAHRAGSSPQRPTMGESNAACTTECGP